MLDIDKIVEKLEADGVKKVEKNLSAGAYAPQRKVEFIEQWLEKQKNAPTCMYHPTKARSGETFKASEIEYLEKQGWYDTPAKFPKENKLLVILKIFLLNKWEFIISTIIAIAAIYFAFIK